MRLQLSFLLLFCHALNAQDPYFINYTISDGLPSNTIYSSFQDKTGFLWFATDVGIVKYDSKNFKIFNTENGLSDNEVFQIKEDHKGRKWLLTLNGVPSYIEKDSIYNEENSFLIEKCKSSSMLIDFYEDELNTIYLTYRKGEIITIDKNNNVSKIFKKKTSLSGTWVNNQVPFCLASEGIINTSTKKRIHKTQNSHRIYHDKKNTYYSSFNSLYKIKPDNLATKLLTLPKKSDIINVYIENDEKSWVCTRNGLFLYRNNLLVAHYFQKAIISSITKDIEGNYWLTTLDKGLLFVPSFEVKQLRDSEQKPIKINCISAKNKDEILFGGIQNDYYFKKNDSFFKKNLNSSWRKDHVMNIRFFDNDTYIINKSGILKTNPQKNKNIPYNSNDLLIDNETLFIASNFTSKLKVDDLNKEIPPPLNQRILLRKRSTVLTQSNDKTLWIGTNFGLYSYTKKDSIIFWGKENKNLSTSINDLYYDDENNSLLIASASKGLIVITDKKTSNHISVKTGLNNNTCNSIEKVGNNNYLIGTNKGLNLLTFKNQNASIANYNTSLGFKNTRINDITFFNDTIYLAANRELLYFNYKYLKQRKTKPICIINQQIADKKIVYENNDISIEYAGISYIDQGDVNYYYKINNYNDEWSHTKESQINYKSLSAKQHTFSVYCVNGFGEKSNTASISFTILKPFWQKWWFLILIAATITTLVLCIWKARMNYVNLQFEKERKALFLENENIALENQMLALEQKALRLQMNPHFIFNALNTIKGYYSEGSVREASDYISKFSKLLRLLLENVDQYIPLALEIEMLTLYLDLAKARYQETFDYQIKTSEDLVLSEVFVPTLLLQPIVENAIIHGIAPKKEKGYIQISFTNHEETLLCTVTDNGIGRLASERIKNIKHDSKASDIIKERLQLIENQEGVNCHLKFFDLEENDKSKGTKVEIKIPLIKYTS